MTANMRRVGPGIIARRLVAPSAVVIALLAYFGCGDVTEPGGPGEAAVGGDPGAAPCQKLGRGTLVPPGVGCPENQWELCEKSSAARDLICVSVDVNGDITSIDEFPCVVAWEMHECAPGDCPWIRCGGCWIHVERPGNCFEGKADSPVRPWILGSARGSEVCKLFDGTYEVYADESCGRRPAR